MGYNHLNIGSMEVVTITPAMAIEMMKNNASNRALNRNIVKQYSREMTCGDWCLTHQGIALNKNGSVVDGQHRLMAIIDSGCSVKMTIAHYDTECTATSSPFDLQRRRSISDITGLNAKTAQTITYIVRNLDTLPSNRVESRLLFIVESKPELIKWYDDNITRTTVKTYSSASVKAALLMAHIAGYEWVDQYNAMVIYNYDVMNSNTHSLYKKLNITSQKNCKIIEKISFGATFMAATSTEDIKIYTEAGIEKAWDKARKIYKEYFN